MSFGYSEEQVALSQIARDIFAKASPASRLRELWDGGERDPQVWQSLADAGLVGLVIPESFGGSGGTVDDLAIVLEEAGRACLPEPLLDTAAVAVPALVAAGGQVAQRWLPQIAAGETVVAVQLADQPYVVDADVADLLLIEVDGGLHAVTAEGFTAHAVAAEDRTRRLFSVEVDVGERIGDAAVARLHGALGTAAQLNGIAGALLDMTVDYVKVRQQFGVAVGSFQAVKHKLASVHTALASSRAATRLAALAVAGGDAGAATAVGVAKAHAAEVAALANTEALQCHGGIGFTWEHDLHFWLKRGRALEHAYGSARTHRAVVAAALLDGKEG
jgi:alkylation response protein AidB-like acyl-CoA dehydrogenase